MTKKTVLGGKRRLAVRVNTAKRRKASSTNWLKRQLNDPYVVSAKEEGYRSRAIYKLKEIDEKFKLFKPGMCVVDLGAAPGSWSQYALENVKSKGSVVAIDLSDMEPLAGVIFIKQDFTEDEAETQLFDALQGREVDVVLSDMAAPASGHAATDHLRIVTLCELAMDFAKKSLKQDGSFVAKILQGGASKELLDDLKKNFKVVKHFKPAASRSDSAEMYVVALEFRGS